LCIRPRAVSSRASLHWTDLIISPGFNVCDAGHGVGDRSVEQWFCCVTRSERSTSILNNAGGEVPRKCKGRPRKTSGRSYSQSAPRCAPLRLAKTLCAAVRIVKSKIQAGRIRDSTERTAVVSPYNFSLLPFRPPRLSGFAGALFALLCREFLSRGLSAPPPELDSCLILFDHAIFALDLCAAVRITLSGG